MTQSDVPHCLRAVSEFKGTVVLVSHEPEFYEGFVDEVINFENVSKKLI